MTSRPDAALDPVQDAVTALSAGRPVVVVDDERWENEGDLVLAAATATAEQLAFLIRNTSGVVCVALPGPVLDRLNLPPVVTDNQDPKGTAYTVSVDARAGVTTGISAADRAHTIRALADPQTQPADLTRPGHVFPLRAVEGGVLRLPGHTEAAVDLTRLAGLPPGGAIAEITNPDGTMARLPQLPSFARGHGLPILSIAALTAHRWRTEPLVKRVIKVALPTRHGPFRAVGYAAPTRSRARRPGSRADRGRRHVLVRLHSEYLTGDGPGSARCDCGTQLDAALRATAAEGRGVVVYLRGHEGRGIGLLDKLRAYALQDGGADTVQANLALGLPVDARNYAAGAQILADLGVRSVRLLTNNPAKLAGLAEHGLAVTGRVPLPVAPTQANLRYLQAKRDHLGHQLADLPEPPGAYVDRTRRGA